MRNLQNGVYYEPYNSDIMQAVQYVGGQVNTVSNQIQVGMDEVIRKVDAATRKPRKAKTSEQVICLQDGGLAILDVYDDGTRDVKPFAVNARGPWTVMRLRLSDAESDEFFAIILENPSTGIIGRYEKTKANYLYDLFIWAGIKFDPCISRSKISELLFMTFAPQIESSQNIVTISSKAGWMNGKMISRENFPFAAVREFAKLPVMQKSLASIEMSAQMWKAYFGELSCVCGWRERFWIMIFPFLSILSSLLNEENRQNRISLNLVPVGNFSTRRCCCWFKLFNRSKLYPVDAALAEKEIVKEIAATKDETLILDCRTKRGENSYQKGKKCRNQEKAQAIFSGDVDLPTGEAEAGLVTISDNLVRNSFVCNILLSEESLKSLDMPTELVEKSVGGVMAEFIRFIELQMTEVQHIIKRSEQVHSIQAEPLAKVLEIVQMFGQYEGINFLASAGLREDFDVMRVIDQGFSEPEDIMSAFVKAIRREAKNFVFVRKEAANLSGDEICYDEHYIWFSSEQLKRILKRQGLGKYVTEILHTAQKCHQLITDIDGSLTRRLQRGNIRQERYQFCREFLENVGVASIVDLGKEKDKDERSGRQHD